MNVLTPDDRAGAGRLLCFTCSKADEGEHFRCDLCDGVTCPECGECIEIRDRVRGDDVVMLCQSCYEAGR